MKTVKHANFRELIPEEGKVLTQSAEVPAESRIYATAVCLGKGARVDAWKEVDKPDDLDDLDEPSVIDGED